MAERKKRKANPEWDEELRKAKLQVNFYQDRDDINKRGEDEIANLEQSVTDRALVQLQRPQGGRYFVEELGELDRHIIAARLRIIPRELCQWTLQDFYTIMAECERFDELKGVQLGPRPHGGFMWPNRRKNDWSVRLQYESKVRLPVLDFNPDQWQTKLPSHPRFKDNLIDLTGLRRNEIPCDVAGPVKLHQLIRFCLVVGSFGHKVVTFRQFKREHVLAMSYRDIHEFLRYRAGINLSLMKIICDYAQIVWVWS